MVRELTKSFPSLICFRREHISWTIFEQGNAKSYFFCSPARVLACSMDTSSRRYAIAILLDGRLGMVCDVSSLKTKSKRSNVTPTETMDSPSSSSQTTVDPRGASFLDRVTLTNSAQSPCQPFIFPGIASTGLKDEPPLQDVVHSATTSGPGSRTGSISRLDILKDSRMDKLPGASLEDVKFGSRCFMPVENGPHSFYRNICSDDDPPRSVSQIRLPLFFDLKKFSIHSQPVSLFLDSDTIELDCKL